MHKGSKKNIDLEKELADKEARLQQLERELEIEAALEKVRVRSIAMRNSEELKEVIQILFDQLVHLGVFVEHSGFIIDYKNRDDMLIWLADKNAVFPQISIPYFDSPHWNSFIEAKENGLELFTNELDFEVKNKFYTELFQHIPELSPDVKEYYLTCPGLAISTVLMDNVGLYIENFSGTLYTKDENRILLRFGKVFQQTYTRFLDLQKAEEQAQEAKIEASLERVRAKGMAMHHTNELQEVIDVIGKELMSIGIEAASMALVERNQKGKDITMWGSTDSQDNIYIAKVTLPYIDNPIHTSALENFKKGISYITASFSKSVKDEYYRFIFGLPAYSHYPEERKEKLLSAPSYIRSTAIEEHIGLGIIRYDDQPFSEADNNIIKRFAKVFDQTYTRYLDLQKAEEQAREAQIEAALERVRSRTMAMHQSSELKEVAILLNHELRNLGFPNLFESGFLRMDENDEFQNGWLSDFEGKGMDSFALPLKGDWVLDERFQSWKEQKPLLRQTIGGQKLHDHIHFCRPSIESDQVWQQVEQYFSDPTYFYHSYFKHGGICVISRIELSKEQEELITRFAKVFEQTYTRFLDLQKAEAQAREAQIEAALERVRAATMAMHKSEELANAAAVMCQELCGLGLPLIRSGFDIFDESKQTVTSWLTTTKGEVLHNYSVLPIKSHSVFEKMWSSWKKDDYFEYKAFKRTLTSFFKTVAQYSDVNNEYDQKESGVPSKVYIYEFWFQQGGLRGSSLELLDEVQIMIALRFAKVFEQTYTRFLDLQKSEKQAREAKIEAALERVRSASLAMHKSSELVQVATIVYQQLLSLGFDQVVSGGFLMPIEEEGIQKCWFSETDSDLLEVFHLPYSGDKILEERLEYWRANKTFLEQTLSPKELKKHMNFIFPTDTREKEIQDAVEAMPKVTVFNMAFFKHGYINLIANEKLSTEQQEILIRFTSVFDQTYTRFLDLQRAEIQAREAQIEAALERVRARAMAMHKSEELSDCAHVLFDQLRSLGVQVKTAWFSEFIEDRKLIRTYFTDKSFKPDYTDELLTEYSNGQAFIKAWQNRDPIFLTQLQGESLKDYIAVLAKNPSIKESNIYKEWNNHPDKQWSVVQSPFSKGMIGYGTFEEPTHDDYDLLPRFTKVFDQTFTRFLDLKKAEAQAREAQIEAALERVRAASMAMHQSDELTSIATILFEQIQSLGLEPWSFVFSIFREDSMIADTWASDQTGGLPPIRLPHDKDAISMQLYTGWKQKKDLTVLEVAGKELINHKKYMMSLPGFKEITSKRKASNIELPTKQIFHGANFEFGYLLINTLTPCPEYWNIFKRFAKVFEQTYTRFLDLQKAERQSREAQIEASLERVRARAMAMQSSEELIEVAHALRTQMGKLGQSALETSAIHLYEKNDDQWSWESWYASRMPGKEDQEMLTGVVHFDPQNTTVGQDVIKMYNSDQNEYTLRYQGKELEEWFTELRTIIPEMFQSWEGELPDQHVYYFADFSGGSILTVSHEDPSEETKELQQRSAQVFDLAYRRYLDLKQAEEQANKIRLVNEENERLLHSILPEQIAERIRSGEQTIVKRFDQVSILFADIVGFTILSEKISPQEVVDILNGLFSRFDDLTDRYKLEKIKTIGDAYMVASGVPEVKKDHAHAIFNFARDMQNSLYEFNKLNKSKLDLRIGISSGPVVAGVIGKKKFAYDLWGDTVNTAARMEAFGKPGRIQVSPEAFEILKDDFEFEKVPNVPIKGKGLMDVYLWKGE